MVVIVGEQLSFLPSGGERGDRTLQHVYTWFFRLVGPPCSENTGAIFLWGYVQYINIAHTFFPIFQSLL